MFIIKYLLFRKINAYISNKSISLYLENVDVMNNPLLHIYVRFAFYAMFYINNKCYSKYGIYIKELFLYILIKHIYFF